jgi:hypothetical protein
MRSLLGSLRHLILGETWTIPVGVGATLVLAALLRGSMPEAAWKGVGGFCLAALVLGTLVWSLRRSTEGRL